MTRIISVSAGKGGVGKTTTVSNLGVALSKMGKDVTIVDANLTTPNLSIHLGIPLYPITLHDVLKDRAYVTEAMHIDPSGLKVIPASLSLDEMEGVNPDSLASHLDDLIGSTDIIFLDCAAGLGNETIAAMRASHDLIIITNPELPSVTDALKTKKLADELGINILGVVVTRRDTKRKQMSDKEIADMIESPVIGSIPECRFVNDSVRHKTPVVLHKPTTQSSKAYKRLAADLVGADYSEKWDVGFLSRLKSMLAGS